MSEATEFDLKLLLEQYHNFAKEQRELGLTEEQIELEIKKKFNENELEKIKEISNGLPVISEENLANMFTNPIQWHVKDYIPKKSVVMLAGKRASYKSWGALHLAVTIAKGIQAFGRFDTNKAFVLYIDEEGGIETLKERIEMIKKGMNIEDSIDNLGFLAFEGFKIDREDWRKKLENFLTMHNPCVIIADCFRRIITGEENDATEVNRIFTELIRPIAQKYDVTWILIHHLRKGIAGRRPDDIMDELRGSSELTNYADIVLIFDRPPRLENRFILRQAKCRRAKEQQPQIIELEWNENSMKFNCVGTAEEFLDSIDLCSKAIMVWLEENNIDSFKTKEAKEELKKQGYSKATVERTLTALVAQGKILRPKRGSYSRITGTLIGYEASKPQLHQDANEGVKDEKHQ